ncbi:MAG: Rrf2 family transcriptional regulator [Candidatus Marinimicrobia bacterium]|nr:Rrf2 family transcriptional regulator [Candidatus Neomarinimicrobiota bacterium]
MSMLINISEGTSLAFHGLALIVKYKPNRLNIKFLAKHLKASEAHLAKIFQQLVKAKFVTSTRGPNGGFILKKPAHQISFLSIYETIEGKVDLKTCPLGKKYCPLDNCDLDDNLNKISNEIYNYYKKIKLSQFISKEKKCQN